VKKMTDDHALSSRKRNILLAIIGCLIGDASLLLFLYVGPWQWLFGATLGYSLLVSGVARNFRKQSPTAALPAR
jgi:hypothetical protein